MLLVFFYNTYEFYILIENDSIIVLSDHVPSLKNLIFYPPLYLLFKYLFFDPR